MKVLSAYLRSLTLLSLLLAMDAVSKECVVPEGDGAAYFGFQLGVKFSEFTEYSECLGVPLKTIRARDKRTKVVFYDQVVFRSSLFPQSLQNNGAISSLRFAPTGHLASIQVSWVVDSRDDTDELIEVLKKNFGTPIELNNTRGSLFGSANWKFDKAGSDDEIELFEKGEMTNVSLKFTARSKVYEKQINGATELHLSLLEKMQERSRQREKNSTSKYERMF